MLFISSKSWKNNYRGNSSSKPPVIYDSCYLPCAMAPVSLTRATSCYLSCAIALVSLTRAASCYLSCAIAPVSLTRAASCYLPCAITPVSLTRWPPVTSRAPKRPNCSQGLPDLSGQMILQTWYGRGSWHCI